MRANNSVSMCIAFNFCEIYNGGSNVAEKKESKKCGKHKTKLYNRMMKQLLILVLPKYHA